MLTSLRKRHLSVSEFDRVEILLDRQVRRAGKLGEPTIECRAGPPVRALRGDLGGQGPGFVQVA